MKIKNLYIRFYKSFNYDYLRKFNPNASHEPWDYVDRLVYPYVRIPIDRKVTAVVGANESGKSHLLSAIHKGLSGDGIQVEDMCRYSQFQTVEMGRRKVPYFGFEFCELSEEEKSVVSSIFDVTPENFSTFHFFRNQGLVDLFLPPASNGERPFKQLKPKEAAKIQNVLPKCFQIKSEIALPSRVPILSLVKEDKNMADLSASRAVRAAANDFISSLRQSAGLFTNAETVKTNAVNVYELVRPFQEKINSDVGASDAEVQDEEIALARDLICKIAKVDPEALQELYESIRDGKDGHVAGLVTSINSRLDTALNFPNWWVQDKQFRLIVAAREVDLAFTILDRTGTEYSFNERSQGLKYFLSYYVQYLSHTPSESVNEILTMDEPDAFLSSQAQQDLLKIFEAFAEPKDMESRPIQVVYVTHSPFLVDKNHSERIRVLEKGVSEEGTRVVRDAAKNHYEPLRSAFGAFVGETVFIGNTNIFVEGMSDQIILAGAAKLNRRLRKQPDEFLDLNSVTIVPAGGAPHIPYMVYLARGRDSEKPPVIALLDGDAAGTDAKKALLKGGARGKRILSEEYILQLSDVDDIDGTTLATGGLRDMEDLIPLSLCAKVVQKYLQVFCQMNDKSTEEITGDAIKANLKPDLSLFSAVEATVQALPKKPHIEKVGFARTLVDFLEGLDDETLRDGKLDDINEFSLNIGKVFAKLNTMRRAAEREFNEEKITAKFKRLKDGFLRDFPEKAEKQAAFNLFEAILASLDDSVESDSVKSAINRVMSDFAIKTNRQDPIENFQEFRNRLEHISYAVKNEEQVESE